MKEQELIGQLWLNESKNGRQYLRGHVNGAKVVAFKSKDGLSFHVLADTREDTEKKSGGFKKDYSKKEYKPYKKSEYKAKSNDEAPF
jgi:hypothetical protein